MTEAVGLNTSQQQAYNLIQKAKNGDSSAINELCNGIYNATSGQLGTDNDYLDEILSEADNETLALIMDSYSKATGSEIYKDIENELLYNDKDKTISKLETAYQETNGTEYTGNNDGRLTIGQTANSVGKGILNKLPSIGLLAAGTYFAPAIAGAIGTGLTALIGGTAAATIATVGAPILAAVGVATAGYTIYKGVTETKEAIDTVKDSGSDEVTEQAVTQGTEGVIDTAEGVYIGAQSVKGLYDFVKNIKGATTETPEATPETTAKNTSEVTTETTVKEPVKTTGTTEEPIQAQTENVVKNTSTTIEDIDSSSSLLTKKEYQTLMKQNPDEGAHLSLYDWDLNKVMQHYLRTGEIVTSDCGYKYTLDEINKSMKAAEKIFDISKLPKNTKLYRYVDDLSYIPEVGGTYTDSGYFATSMRDGLSRDFGSKKITVYASEGTSCICNGNRFAEVILNKGNSYETLYKDSSSAILLLK